MVDPSIYNPPDLGELSGLAAAEYDALGLFYDSFGVPVSVELEDGSAVDALAIASKTEERMTPANGMQGAIGQGDLKISIRVNANLAEVKKSYAVTWRGARYRIVDAWPTVLAGTDLVYEWICQAKR